MSSETKPTTKPSLERRRVYIKPDWPAPEFIKAYTTTRQFFRSQASLSVADMTNQLMEKLSLPSTPIWLKQVHGKTVVEAVPTNQATDADASCTTVAQRICMVQTADCLPILLCHPMGKGIAAIHAGWRGLAQGVIEATLQALSLPPRDLLAWLGPAIGPTKFLVGQLVYDAFTLNDVTTQAAFIPHSHGKWLANLYSLAQLRLTKQGVNQIYGGEFCTFSQSGLFFSYRRAPEEAGRMLSLIWMD